MPLAFPPLFVLSTTFGVAAAAAVAFEEVFLDPPSPVGSLASG